MFPLSLKLENFLSYSQETELDFTEFNVAVLSGANGAGKSSLLDAFTWAIWGKARNNIDDMLISFGKNYMWVEVVLRDENQEYRILRSRKKGKRGKTSLDFFSRAQDSDNWTVRTGRTVKETEGQIVKAINLSSELFTNSAYLKQGKADEFTVKTPIERKSVLSEILLLSFWDEYVNKIKDRERNLIIEQTALESNISSYIDRSEDEKNLTRQINNYNINIANVNIVIIRINTKIEPLKTKALEHARIFSRRETLLERYGNLKQKAQKLTTNRDQTKKELALLEHKFKNRDAVQKSYQLYKEASKKLNEFIKKESSIKILEKRKYEIETKIKVNTAKNNAFIDELERKIKDTEFEKNSQINIIDNMVQCPTCFRNFKSAKEKQEAKNNIKNETAKKLLTLKEKLTKHKIIIFPETKTLASINDEIKNVGYDTDAHQKTSEVCEKYKQATIEKEILKQIEIQIKDKKHNLNNLNNQLLDQQNEITSIINEGKELQQKLETLKIDTQRLAELEKDLANRQTQKQKIAEVLSQCKLQIEHIRTEKKRIKDTQKRVEHIKEEIADLKMLIDACGKNGIQASLIEETLPILEEKANNLLAELSDGQMTLAFETERQRRVGEGTIETLDIHIADSIGTRPYENYSGGEAFRINLAIRIALSFLLAERAGSRVEFLVIDEGFGALDLGGRDALIKSLSMVKNYFQKILIITHINELKEEFPTEIQVTKTKEGSTLFITSHGT